MPGSVGGNATSASADDLNEQETELFADGPIDLPVSIAKLDSPDPDKISISAETLGSQDVSAYLVTGNEDDEGALAELNATNGSDELHLTITGAAGCVSDRTATPYVVAYRMVDYVVDTTSERIISVNEDGSFALEMDVPSKEQVIYAAMQSDRATASPFTSIIADLDIIEQNNGIFILVDTNSEKINTNQSMVADKAGYYYMTLTSNDENYFMRRNIDGSAVQFLIEGSPNNVFHVAASNGTRVAYTDSNADLYLMLPTTDQAAASLSLQKDPLQTTVAQSVNLIAHIDHFTPEKGGLFVTDDGKGIIYGQNDDFPTIKYYRTSSDFVVDLIPPGVADDIKGHYATNANYLYVFAKTFGTYDFFRLDLNGSVGRAWADRETLLTNILIDQFLSIDISDTNTMITETKNNDITKLSYWSEETGLVTVHQNTNGNPIYNAPHLSRDGEFLVVCQVFDQINGTGNQLFYTQLSDPLHEFHALTSDPDFSTCTGRPSSFSIDQNNYIHFYRTAVDGTTAQHAMININSLY